MMARHRRAACRTVAYLASMPALIEQMAPWQGARGWKYAQAAARVCLLDVGRHGRGRRLKSPVLGWVLEVGSHGRGRRLKLSVLGWVLERAVLGLAHHGKGRRLMPPVLEWALERAVLEVDRHGRGRRLKPPVLGQRLAVQGLGQHSRLGRHPPPRQRWLRG